MIMLDFCIVLVDLATIQQPVWPITPNSAPLPKRPNNGRGCWRTIPSLKSKVTACVQHGYDRYIAGELSWTEMRQGLETTNA
jgi:hypothetical protein